MFPCMTIVTFSSDPIQFSSKVTFAAHCWDRDSTAAASHLVYSFLPAVDDNDDIQGQRSFSIGLRLTILSYKYQLSISIVWCDRITRNGLRVLRENHVKIGETGQQYRHSEPLKLAALSQDKWVSRNKIYWRKCFVSFLFLRNPAFLPNIDLWFVLYESFYFNPNVGLVRLFNGGYEQKAWLRFIVSILMTELYEQ
jgi:hypothetical protein